MIVRLKTIEELHSSFPPSHQHSQNTPTHLHVNKETWPVCVKINPTMWVKHGVRVLRGSVLLKQQNRLPLCLREETHQSRLSDSNNGLLFLSCPLETHQRPNLIHHHPGTHPKHTDTLFLVTEHTKKQKHLFVQNKKFDSQRMQTHTPKQLNLNQFKPLLYDVYYTFSAFL